LVFVALSEAARAALENLMAGGTYELQSDFAKKHRAKGRAEGEAKGRAQAILDVLEARGLPVSDEARVRASGPSTAARSATCYRIEDGSDAADVTRGKLL
jgi:hypothetical protein